MRRNVTYHRNMSEVINIKELNERIERESVFIDTLNLEMGKVIVGQKHLVDTLLIGLLSNGHILLEGVPGLAKTLAITTLAQAVDARFSRIQFTPDLLPADLLGTLIYSQKTEEFWATRPTGFPSRFWCSLRRTRSSRRALTRCPRRRSTVSCSRRVSPIPKSRRSAISCV